MLERSRRNTTKGKVLLFDIYMTGILLTSSLTRTPTLFAPSSRRMGKAVLDVVGSGRSEVTAYWPHALQMALVTAIPESLLNVVMIRVALQKKDEEEKGIKSE